MSNNISVKDVVKKIKSGEIDIRTYNLAFVDRVKMLEPKVRAWAYFNEETWLDQCEKVKQDVDPAFSSLLGIPVGVKDIFNTADMPTQMGSPIWKDFTPGNDARVVYNIRYNHGIIAGKTVTAEFAVHAPNETRNPWNLEHSPGTSSSGSAAAVSCGMVPLALATQTAGSVIRPASYCGIYGYKPSFGTIPRTAMLKTTDSLDTIGFFATNVDDCRLLFDTIRVHGLDYPIVHQHLGDISRQQKLSDKWKVGVVSDQHWTFDHAKPYATEALSGLISRMNGLAEITRPVFSETFANSHTIQETIYHKALSYYFKKEFEKQTLISPVMYEIVNEGRKISPEQYQDALKMQQKLAGEIDRLFENTDVLIALSTSATAPDFGIAIDPPDTCLIWTMCGLPVINIPLFNHDGMPFGLQVIGRKYSDYKLISFIKDMVEAGLFPEFSVISNPK